MEIVGEIASVLGAGAAGGVVGIFGSLLGVGSKYLMKREERKAQKEANDYELKLIEAQMKQAGRNAEHEIAIAAQAGQYEAFNSAIEAQASTPPSYKWVDAIRALFRPFLTIMLWVLSYLVFKDLSESVNPSASVVSFAGDLYFAAGSATGFWFADRSFIAKGQR